jgi:hypothetical protein
MEHALLRRAWNRRQRAPSFAGPQEKPDRACQQRPTGLALSSASRAGDPGGRQRSGLLHFLLHRISPAHRSPCWPASRFAALARCPIRSPCPQGPPLTSQPRSARRSQRYQSNENMVFRKVSLGHAASPTHERLGAEAGFPQGARARGCAWTFSPEQQARDPPGTQCAIGIAIVRISPQNGVGCRRPENHKVGD